MRRLWVVLSAAVTSFACSSDDGVSGADRPSSGGTSGQANGGTSGIESGQGGAIASGAGGGVVAGSGTAAGGGGGAAGAGAGSSGAGAGDAGHAGDSGGGVGGAAGSTAGGDAGTSAAGAGMGGQGPTRCEDPLDTGDTSRFDTSELFETYTVMGTTAGELRTSVNENRGMDYDALTSSHLSWSFQGCTNPTWIVSLEIDYLLPEWDPPASADPDLVDAWQTYIDALQCHEYGHGRIAVDCANEVMDAFESLQETGDCAALQENAQSAFDTVLDACAAREVMYDADTNHGATMGAVFPP